MNALELADIVDQWAWHESAEYLYEAATMLRQQQAEIEALRHDIEDAECVKLCLDKENVPKKDDGGDLSLWGRVCAHTRQLQAENEALKMGFANSGTGDSELAEVRAMANRFILKIQELEFEREGYENLTEMLESEKAELVEKNRQQQAEIEALKKQLEPKPEPKLVNMYVYYTKSDAKMWFDDNPPEKFLYKDLYTYVGRIEIFK